MAIQILDERTIGKIAAGEVIERPASVVKELVENALDAGARAIRVEIEAGGKRLIRVSDDGAGIPLDELSLALERHATSKLRAFEDLRVLRSYGFRGEALASIAAVSDLEIVSLARGAGHGGRLRARFGRIESPTPVAASRGTTVTARDLFANVPARLKFLRQDGTEAAYVQRAVAAAALAYPEVRFDLIVDGKTALTTDGSGDLGSALVGVFGADTAAQMVPVEPVAPSPNHGARSPIGVSGYISLPALTRGNRQQIVLLVNRRPIESRALSFALEQSYHSLIMAGRYPVAVVNLDVPPERVDVNVHPTKREVRFSEERLVFAALQRAVRGTLMTRTPAQSIPTIIESPLSPSTVQRRLALANPERAAHPGPPAKPDSATAGEPSARAPGNGAPVLRVLGQVGAAYIIAEGPDGMYLIDQHAAHERVLLERLLAQQARKQVYAQRLLEPLVIELTPAQLAVVEESTEELHQLGFEIERFGGQAVAVRAVPAIMNGRDPGETLRVILDELAAGGRGDSRLERLAMTTACHAAIRAGQLLSLAEMRELVIQLEQCTAPRACAHGRPTMLHLSQDELERQFARR